MSFVNRVIHLNLLYQENVIVKLKHVSIHAEIKWKLRGFFENWHFT